MSATRSEGTKNSYLFAEGIILSKHQKLNKFLNILTSKLQATVANQKKEGSASAADRPEIRNFDQNKSLCIILQLPPSPHTHFLNL